MLKKPGKSFMQPMKVCCWGWRNFWTYYTDVD